jgi:hypothetical protein
MRQSICWLAFAALAWPLTAAELTFDFSQTPEGQPPAGFRSSVSGEGKPGDWQVRLDDVPSQLQTLTPGATQTAKRPVVAQLAKDATDEHFPVLIYDGDSYGDFTFTTQFKIVDGTAEEMAGVAFRILDEKNYYVIRASALGNNLRFYKFVDGVRSAPIGPDVTITKGVWHELKVQCQGSQIASWLDGQALIPPLNDGSFSSGKIGFWTKSDSVSYFADAHLTYTPREALAQRAVRDVAGLYPRLLDILIYAPKGGTDTNQLVAIASKADGEVGQPAPESHQGVFSREVTLFRPGVDDFSVVMPLRDRDGEVIAAVEVKLKKNFMGQTEQNAVVRTLPVVKALEARIQTAKDLVP